MFGCTVIKVTIVLSGFALCGEAQHICERHHKLRDIPVHTRHIPAHRSRLPKEPAGHAFVSGKGPGWMPVLR